MKENDIWWQGVVWDQFHDRLRIFLPGAMGRVVQQGQCEGAGQR